MGQRKTKVLSPHRDSRQKPRSQGATRWVGDRARLRRLEINLQLIAECRLLFGVERARVLCRKLKIPGLGDASPIQSAPEKINDSDSITHFMKDCVVQHEPATAWRVSASDFFQHYETWCSGNGSHRLNPKAFSRALRDRGIKRVKASQIFYLGIELLPNAKVLASLAHEVSNKEGKLGG